jgi:FkbM family methyltransferase
MRTVTLEDGTSVHCLVRSEALVLDHHVEGYFAHGVDIRAGDVVFDVGANVGVFAVRAAQRHPDVRIFAFEPVPAIFEVLKRNSEAFGEGRIVPVAAGVSSAPGTMQIHYYPHSPALSTGHPEFWDERPGMLAEAVRGQTQHAPRGLWYARLVPGWLSHAIARRLRGRAQRITCELQTLSTVIDAHGLERVDVLKIDCEGAELAALQGLEERHWPLVRAVVAEVHDIDGRLQTIRDLLTAHGLSRVVTERESGFEHTPMINIYATRERPREASL